jgi:hypothetical protein
MVGYRFCSLTPARRPLEERHAISLGTISSTREWWHPIMRRTLGYFIQNNFSPDAVIERLRRFRNNLRQVSAHWGKDHAH